MSQSISKKWARSVSIIICSLWLGLSGVLAQTDPAFLVKRGITDTVHSELLGEDRLIYVDFPLGYDPSSARKYPVAFLLDGDVLLPAAGTVQDYYSGGYTPDMIIIGISNAENRTRDLTPPKFIEAQSAVSSDPMAVAMTPNAVLEGGAPAFLDFIENELIPYVEANYPVTQFRTLIGHSYGGLFTLFTLAERPALFNYYLAIDPSMNWSGGHYHYILPEKLSETSLEGRSVFITMSGQLHMQDTSVTLENVREDDSWPTEFPRAILKTFDQLEALAPTGLRVGFQFFERDLHGTVPLPSLMEGLIALFDWYQMEGTHKINDPATSVATLSKIINHRAAKLEHNFGYAVPPYPEELLNMSGYMQMDMGDLEKSEMYFTAVLEHFPNSANAYDSMADFYEATQAYPAAAECMKKAILLDPLPRYKERLDELTVKIKP
jgi:predicted alpha/beta superfamily hydrolase